MFESVAVWRVETLTDQKHCVALEVVTGSVVNKLLHSDTQVWTCRLVGSAAVYTHCHGQDCWYEQVMRWWCTGSPGCFVKMLQSCLNIYA